MKLQNAVEMYEAAPKGRYKCKITAAETQISAKGSPMIKLSVEIREGDHAGKSSFDYLITDDSFKGAGMAKIKLRGLGVDVDAEQSDEAVCGQLLGREVFADLDQEQAQTKEKTLKFQTHPKTGQQVPIMNNRVVAYHTAAVDTTRAPVPNDVMPPRGGVRPPAFNTPPGTVQAAPPVAAAFPGFPGAVAKPAAHAAPAAAPEVKYAQPPFAGVPAPTNDPAPEAKA